MTPAGFLPSGLVRIAVRALPAGVSRNRYRDEFLAELHGMPRGQQFGHATGVLTHVLSLRLAVTTEYLAGDGDLMTNTTTGRPLLCRLNLHHHWRTRSAEDGARYRRCARCGKDDFRRGGPMDQAGFGLGI